MSKAEEKPTYLWYTRDYEGVKGPFTIGMLRRFILVGRLKMESEISEDRKTWRKVKDTPEVIPEEMKNIHTEEGRDRLRQAQLREDERARERRQKQDDIEYGNLRKGDRRGPETGDVVAHRDVRNHLHEQYQQEEKYTLQSILVGAFILALIITGISIYFVSPDDTTGLADCDAQAAPGVNWRNCQKEGVMLARSRIPGANMNTANLAGADLQQADLDGADLSYANLSLANLSGANLGNARLRGTGLRNADLRNAQFYNADLSYADLRGARLAGANLSGARLDKAIWIDGTICAPGSRGECKELLAR